jgi:hypothetical protein
LEASLTSAFDNLCGPGRPLRAEAPDAREFAGLQRSALARLADARQSTLSLESRFDLVYNAAHALSLAALRWHGYRSGNRYIVFQLLVHSLALGPEVWRVLAKGHELRNLGEYEGDLAVEPRLVADMIQACQAVANALAVLPPIQTPPGSSDQSPGPN